MTARAWGLLGFAFALLLSAFSVRAETTTPTTTTTAKTTVYGYGPNGNLTAARYATLAEAAAAASAASVSCTIMGSMAPDSCSYSGGVGLCSNMAAALTTGQGLCRPARRGSDNALLNAIGIGAGVGQGFSLGSSLGCASPAVEVGGQCQSTTCPANGGWTLSGGVCTRPDCVAPQTRNPTTGACEIICPAAGSNAMIGGAQAWGISGTSATCTSGISYSGCKITCTAGVSSSGKASCTGCTFTGALSTPADAAADPTTGEEIKTPTKPEECLAKGMGYVTTSSGTTCVAQDQAVEPISTKTTETTTTKNGAGTVTGTQETTVECTGDKCTTTTTTKDGAGVTTGTTTTTGTGDKSGTDPTKDKQSECEKHPETIGCSQYGTPVEDGPLTTNSVGTSSLTPSLSSSGTCPADINLPKGMKFSWEYVCMYASGIRPVIIALAWLSAGFLLFGMRLD